MNRGYAGRASGLAFFEALAYILALRVVVQNITNVLSVFAYALGFSVGIFTGIRMEHWLALGFITIHAFRIPTARRSPAGCETLVTVRP